MKVNCKALLEAITEAKHFANSRAAMPILATILLRYDTASGQLTVAATDLNKNYVETLAAVESGELAACVDAKRLHEVVKALKGELVELTATSTMALAKLTVLCGTSKFVLNGLPTKDYPELAVTDSLKWAQIDGIELEKLFEATCFSVSTDETRAHLNGLLIESDGSVLRTVSTDGHRLSVKERSQVLPKMIALVPRHALVDIRRMLDGKVEFAIEKGWLAVRQFSGRAVLSVKLADAQFPPWQQIIPKELNRIATIDRPASIESLKRAMLCASEKSLCTSWVWTHEGSAGDGRLTISADDPDKGEASEVLPFKDGERLTVNLVVAGTIVPDEFRPFSIGFNGKYMLEALQHIEAMLWS